MDQSERQVNYSERHKTILAWTLVIFLIALSVPKTQAFLVKMYENISFAIAPSAERAFFYGSRHFNAKNPSQYDIDRAEYFYREVESYDPTYPYVYHQLARIEFLRGNFNTALFYINRQIDLHGESVSNSYYVRGLIEGYMGRYEEAAKDYERFLESHPTNWAALNDYAWVLLMGERFEKAAEVSMRGLVSSPGNPWLLNSYAIASFELGKYAEALEAARTASEMVSYVSTDTWLWAYPGNDPRIAGEGIATLKKSILDNMHMIELALERSEVE